MEKRFKRVVPNEVNVDELTPLDITCGATKCNEDLHCFSLKSSIKKPGTHRVCRECEKDMIDWTRVYKNDLKDAPFIFESLRKELIRYVVWNTDIEQVAVDRAIKKGRTKLREHAYNVVKNRIRKHTIFDGRQTPLGGNDIVNFAQHATATCCRKCLEAWHNIPQDITLDKSQMDFCTELIMLYIDEKVPDLK